jgi:xanthine dehydrogenase accessory factor
MIVASGETRDTIGGGNLEADCIERARTLLATPTAPATQLVRYPLGPGTGQCCGGATTILFHRIAAVRSAWIATVAAHARAGEPCVIVTGAEGRCSGATLVATHAASTGSLGEAALDATTLAQARALLAEGRGVPRLQALDAGDGTAVVFLEPLWPSALQLVLFGAGHVGRALVKVLGDLDCRVTWVDSRADAFPAAVPAIASVTVSDEPADEVDRAPAGAYFLVMTHSHALDFELCERILKRGDFAYLGLIGSTPKRNRFVKNLNREGVTEAALARLTCPIGIAGISGKRPATIAVAVAAELLQVHEAAARGRPVAADRAVTR